MRAIACLSTVLVLLGLAGCGGRRCINYGVRVTSTPPGARIEINGESVGTAPCRATICGLRGRLFLVDSEIRAFPQGPDQRQQIKRYEQRWQIPKTVHFDMTLPPE